MDPLTPRQTEVAMMVASGKSYKRIAGELGVSLDTVKEHVHQAAARLPGRGSPKLRVVIFALSVMRAEEGVREAS